VTCAASAVGYWDAVDAYNAACPGTFSLMSGGHQCTWIDGGWTCMDDGMGLTGPPAEKCAGPIVPSVDGPVPSQGARDAYGSQCPFPFEQSPFGPGGYSECVWVDDSNGWQCFGPTAASAGQ